MNIWLITIGEPLPIVKVKPRLLRTGIFANCLQEQGHNVTWWTSDFDHTGKYHHFGKTTSCQMSEAGFRPISADQPTHIDQSERVNAASTEGSIATLSSLDDFQSRDKRNTQSFLLHGRGYKRNISLARIRDHQEIANEFWRLACAQPKPDIILSSHPTLALCEYANRYGKEHSIPVLIDIRDLWPDKFVDITPRFAQPVMRFLLNSLFKKTAKMLSDATGIIGITEPILQWGLDLANRKRNIYDGVFPHGYTAHTTDKVPLKESAWQNQLENPNIQLKICFFGTIGKFFNFDPVFKALEQLEQENIACHLFIAGAGDSAEQLAVQAQHKKNITYVGFINAPEIANVIHHCHVGIAPYVETDDFERTLSNKVIEYLSGGLPVITSIEGYMGPFFRQYEAGFSYDSQNPISLVNILKTLILDKKKLHLMQKNAKNLYETQFRADKVYSDYAQHLEQVVVNFSKNK
jgi:glycosyltransferase involved in cell wall biosynthesis